MTLERSSPGPSRRFGPLLHAGDGCAGVLHRILGRRGSFGCERPLQS